MKKLFSRFQKSEPVITLVSGLPRSGTSMMMRMLEKGGIAPMTDKIRAADDDNPKGYYEYERAKKLRDGDTAWLPDAEGKVVKTISALLKHLPPGYRYQVIFMRRAMGEILASQKRMLVNRGEDPDKVDDEEMARLFENHLQDVTRWLDEQAHFRVLYVNYNEIIEAPLPAIERINDFMGGSLDRDAMASVIDPALYRQRKEAA